MNPLRAWRTLFSKSETRQADDASDGCRLVANFWTDGLMRNTMRIGNLKAKIEELQKQNDKMKKAAAQRREVCKGDLEKYEEDKETMKKYKAYFDLKTDELDALHHMASTDTMRRLPMRAASRRQHRIRPPIPSSQR
ncbi:hypothetical protein LTR85_003922 [Meristemomyces frigidus]|nr:hypothetical protein LTR85_003922 [Meristemomyces frigidus]